MLNNYSIGPLKNLIIFGSAPYLNEIEDHCIKSNINFFFITTKSQLNKLERRPKNILVLEKINENKIRYFLKINNFDQSCLAISISARWIFKKKFIKDFLNYRLLNTHGTRLPLDRGGGNFTWKIMRGDRLGNILFHIVDEGIDTGQIIINEEYIIPSNKIKPFEIINDYRLRLKLRILKLVKDTKKKKLIFNPIVQQKNISTYNPRINTEVNGYINWDWSPHDIQNFILSFDEPYTGAKTLLNKKVVSLKSTQLHMGEIGSHPFQSGVIIRKSKGWCIVSLKKGYTLIIEEVINQKNKNIIKNLKLGDKFYTTFAKLEKSKAYRAVIKN